MRRTAQRAWPVSCAVRRGRQYERSNVAGPWAEGNPWWLVLLTVYPPMSVADPVCVPRVCQPSNASSRGSRLTNSHLQ